MTKKSKDDALVKLTTVFQQLGAVDPAVMAQSQLDDGIPQLTRFVFLRQAWTHVIDAEDDSWIDLAIQHAADHPKDRAAGIGHALQRMLDKGVARKDIVSLVRGMQSELLFALCSQLDDPDSVDFLEETMPTVEWGLFQLNEAGEPGEAVGGLQESVLSMDPTRRGPARRARK